MPQNQWNIKEKQLEDWLVAEPEKALWEGVKILERQVRLPHGVLDVLAHDDESIIAIELKARPIKPEDISQLFRYVYDIHSAISCFGADGRKYPFRQPRFLRPPKYPPLTFASVEEAVKAEIYDHRNGIGDWSSAYPVTCIKPVLFGPSIERLAHTAALGAGIWVYSWSYDSEIADFLTEWEFYLPSKDFMDEPSFTEPDWLLRLHGLSMGRYAGKSALLEKRQMIFEN
jgi:hypothetical protein